jgi:hypothetical protein
MSGVKNSMKARLRWEGRFLRLSLSIGPGRTDFNAHRVFAVKTISDLAGENLRLMEFANVDDAGELHENIQLTDESTLKSLGCYYGCGNLVFRQTIGSTVKVNSNAQR